MGRSCAISICQVPDGYLPFVLIDRSVHQRLPEQDACVVNKVSGFKIVSPVEYNIEVFEDVQRIVGIYPGADRQYFYLWVCCCSFSTATSTFSVQLHWGIQYLPVQITNRNSIIISDRQCSHTCGGEVLSGGASSPPVSDHQHFRILQFSLCCFFKARQVYLNYIAGDLHSL